MHHRHILRDVFWLSLPVTVVLLEVKFNEAIPAWLCTCLNRLNFQVQRLSKYCVGIEQSGMIDP